MTMAHSTVTQEGQTLPGGWLDTDATNMGPLACSCCWCSQWGAGYVPVPISMEAWCTARGSPAPGSCSLHWPLPCLITTLRHPTLP